MDEPKIDGGKENTEPNQETVDSTRLTPRGPHPTTRRTSRPQNEPQNKEKPYWPTVAEAGIFWLRHYWDAPRSKSKWTEIVTVVLTLAIAVAAFWSACIFQGQLKATQNANTDLENQFRAQQRPWLSLTASPKVKGAFTIDKSGLHAAPQDIEFVVKNAGVSPASGVVVDADFRMSADPDYGDKIQASELLMGECDSAIFQGILNERTGTEFIVPQIERTIFAKDGIQTVPAPKLMGGNNIFLVGCIGYGGTDWSPGNGLPYHLSFIERFKPDHPITKLTIGKVTGHFETVGWGAG